MIIKKYRLDGYGEHDLSNRVSIQNSYLMNC